MAQLSTQDFTTLVRNMVAAVQAGASTLVNLNVGSVLRAALESIAGVGLWLQGIAVTILTLTRAATCFGADLDSWMADYNFFRLPATLATGAATFSRLTPTQQAVVPVGAPVQTGDGTQAFTVNLDATNPAYSAALSGYVMAAGVASVTVAVTAISGGSQGNVAAGSISSIAQAISGVDSVTNANPFINGVDAESDPAFKARFILYIAALARATRTSILSAIANVQQGLQATLTENQDYNGATDYGFFYAVVNDGSGYPSSSLLNTVGLAIDAYRPLCSRFAVFAPNVLTANLAMVLTAGTGFVHGTVVAAVAAALQAYIAALPLGASLPYSRIAAVAYGVPGVTNVTAITLNGGTADLTATAQQTILPGVMTIA